MAASSNSARVYLDITPCSPTAESISIESVIKDLVHQQRTGQVADQYEYVSYGITKHHWKPSDSKRSCANIDCGQKFGLMSRKHHCRRCGEVYCEKCTQYQMRLNNLAHPDPQGRLQKVCQSCLGPQTLGATRSLFREYRNSRGGKRQERINKVTSQRPRIQSLRDNIDIDVEMRRLREGFRESVGNSEVKRTFFEFRKMVGIPDWQKASYWDYTSLSTMCCYCNKEFGLLQNRKHPCTVCGFMVCQNCSSKNLIVYIPNEEKEEKYPEPKHAVIKIIGCPEQEPDLCVYLRICSQCHLYLEERQVQEAQQSLTEQFQKTDVFWTKIVDTAKKLFRIREKINIHLPKYQEYINTMGINSGAPRSSQQGEIGIQVLARAQCDMSDLFVTLVLGVEGIRGIKPSTQQQALLLKNLVRANYNFYQESCFLFRELKKTLEDTTLTSTEILETIQKFVDRNAMRAVYVFLKQVALESLLLCDKYKLCRDIPLQFGETEEVVCQDLKQCLKNCGDDWDSCEGEINDVLKDQLQNHRIIKIPKHRRDSQQQAMRQNHIPDTENVILQRSEEIVQRIILQMKDKCSDSRCSASKEALANLYVWLHRQLQKSNENPENKDTHDSAKESWEFL